MHFIMYNVFFRQEKYMPKAKKKARLKKEKKDKGKLCDFAIIFTVANKLTVMFIFPSLLFSVSE